MRPCSVPRIAWLFALVILAMSFVSSDRHASAQEPEPISLPAFSQWKAELAEFKPSGAAGELHVPTNYQIGRAISRTVAVQPDELLTLAAQVQTQYASSQQAFYRCWLELEFLRDQQVVETMRSPELIGTQAKPQLLAVTAAAPSGANAVRAVVCAQNKFWSVVDNRATLSEVRLLRLAAGKRSAFKIETMTLLPQQPGARTATVRLRGNWPDGTALALSSTRGTLPRNVLLANGLAEIPIQYGESEVGSAQITAQVLDHEVSTRLTDPLSATLEIRSIQADRQETPARVQLIRDGVMIPGRYQSNMPGIFMTAPWSIDLAPGRWQLRVCRGPEFRAYEQTLDVQSGQTITLDRLELVRNVDLRTLAWYGGDADGDVYHGEQIYTDVTAETAADISQAMGLDWVGVGGWGKQEPRTWGQARAVLQKVNRPNLLFLWTDEQPKTRAGHACLVGIERPDSDAFGWGWTGARRPLRNFELLQAIRASGAATFVNHPLRWWTSGSKFTTNMYSSLPFDLCAAGLLDGYNVNEKEQELQAWSMLLDHGYQVAATAGADFCLDRPNGPLPGKTRMYCYCPQGLTGPALADAVRQGQTIVSTGPVLVADIQDSPPGTRFKTGETYPIIARAWARADEPDGLLRLELWSHGKAIATQELPANTLQADRTFQWQPQGDWDWVAVRVVSRRGWALTSAFYAASPEWQAPQQPVQCRLTLTVTGLTEQQLQNTRLEVWDNVPALVTSRKLSERPLSAGTTLEVPVSATVVVCAPDGRQQEVSIYDTIGMPEQIERIASGTERERPLLSWQTYEEILRRCRQTQATVTF